MFSLFIGSYCTPRDGILCSDWLEALSCWGRAGANSRCKFVVDVMILLNPSLAPKFTSFAWFQVSKSGTQQKYNKTQKIAPITSVLGKRIISAVLWISLEPILNPNPEKSLAFRALPLCLILIPLRYQGYIPTLNHTYGETFGNATEKYFMDYRSKTLNSSTYPAHRVSKTVFRTETRTSLSFQKVSEKRENFLKFRNCPLYS